MSSILKVSEIQDPTNGNSALTVNSSGQVVLPQNKVAFQAMRSGNLTGYDGTNTQNAIVFNDEIYDISGNYNPATGLFTAPVDGMYTFYGSVYMDGVPLQLWPLLNNARIATLGFANSGGIVMGSSVIRMDANDTLGLKAYTNTSNRIVYSSTVHTLFQGCLTLPL